jgi:hypothetical protein
VCRRKGTLLRRFSHTKKYMQPHKACVLCTSFRPLHRYSRCTMKPTVNLSSHSVDTLCALQAQTWCKTLCCYYCYNAARMHNKQPLSDPATALINISVDSLCKHTQSLQHDHCSAASTAAVLLPCIAVETSNLLSRDLSQARSAHALLLLLLYCAESGLGDALV